MKWDDIKTKNEAELQSALSSERSQLLNLRFRVATAAHKQVHEIKRSRRTIARLATKLGQLKREG